MRVAGCRAVLIFEPKNCYRIMYAYFGKVSKQRR